MRLIAGLATLLSVLCFATGVSAHASLVSTEPADGSVLAQAPKTVQLRFNESVTPAVISLIDATGRARKDATARAVDETIIITMPEELPPGTQVVSYRVISEDGHPVAGSMLFSIGTATGAATAQATASSVAGLIWLVRASGDYGVLEHDVQLSWSARMSYWSHTIDWISQQPVFGWGLDASRAMGPGIDLHPHNGALQVWLELGLVGAVAAAAFWGLSLIRLQREEPNQEMAGIAGSAATFILFAWVNYGLWQQWWLALGAFIPVLAAMLSNRTVIPKSTERPISE